MRMLALVWAANDPCVCVTRDRGRIALKHVTVVPTCPRTQGLLSHVRASSKRRAGISWLACPRALAVQRGIDFTAMDIIPVHLVRPSADVIEEVLA